MISAENINELEKRKIPYIFGTRMRKVKEIREDVLSSLGRYRKIPPEGKLSKNPSPLKVKEVLLNNKRYIVCPNPKQAWKETRDLQAIIDSLEEKIKTNPKSLIGNIGYRKYLKIKKDRVSLKQDKIQRESRFDGKWVLITNKNFLAEQGALKYKELWQLEQVFRDVKSVLEIRPLYHQIKRMRTSGGMCSVTSWHWHWEKNWTGVFKKPDSPLSELTSNKISRLYRKWK
jgi:hypothetical protein